MFIKYLHNTNEILKFIVLVMEIAEFILSR